MNYLDDLHGNPIYESDFPNGMSIKVEILLNFFFYYYSIMFKIYFIQLEDTDPKYSIIPNQGGCSNVCPVVCRKPIGKLYVFS